MKKIATLLAACTVLLLPAFSYAQQIDFAFGASTTFAPKDSSASLSHVFPPEKGGIYPSVSADVILRNHVGFSAEVAVRAKEGLYNGYQNFRPLFYDLNALYAPRISKRFSAELMAGIGGESILFYNGTGNCNTAVCSTYVSSNHFMGHIGGGVRYYFWRRFFVRPEAHLYLIPNNSEFSSDYVGRLGASLGYSLAPR